MAMAAEQSGSSDQITTVLLMSKTGSGKSSLANALLKAECFRVGNGMRSQTKQCEAQMRTVNGRSLLVVDTPGTMDSKDVKLPQGQLLLTLNKCPTGVDAFLILFRADVRFTCEEYQAVQETVDVFGPEACKRAIVVFSNGNRFKNNSEKFAEELKLSREEIPGLDKLMKQFGERYVLMDNGDECDPKIQEKQVATLMSLIDVVSKLNPSKYSNKELDDQTKERKRQEEEAAAKKVDANAKELADLNAEVKMLKLQNELQRQNEQQRYSMQNSGPGLSDVLSNIGAGAGAVLASPVVGAAYLFQKALD